MKKIEINREKFVSLLASLSSVIAIFESFIPSPLPFLRIGFSNIPVMFGFAFLNIKEIIYIVFIKLIISNLFRGTLFSYPFLVGLIANSILIIISFPFFKILKKHISFISLSIIGAISHNTGQLIAALIFVPPDTIKIVSIIILPIGLLTGLINGIICNKIFEKYNFYTKINIVE